MNAPSVFEFYDALSRRRALTDNESLLLEKAIIAMESKQPRRGGMTKAGNAWSREEECRFCDLIANGTPIAHAARMIGRTVGSGEGKWKAIVANFGWQAA